MIEPSLKYARLVKQVFHKHTVTTYKAILFPLLLSMKYKENLDMAKKS